MLTEDLDVLFAGPDAVDVTIGASSFKGILDTPEDAIASGMVISTEYVLTSKTSNFSGLEEMDTLLVSGVSYEARRILKVSDGLLTNVTLSKVTL